MGIKMRVLFISCLVLALAGDVYAYDGTATYYNPPYTPSACFGGRNMGVMLMGASDAVWNHRKVCGKKYRVRCIGTANKYRHPCKGGPGVVVTLVDHCVPCTSTINLSRDAFAKIANTQAGKIRVRVDPL